MRSARMQLLSLLLAAVFTLTIVTIMHVHGVSDPDTHHTLADFMLQFQTLSGILLGCVLVLIQARVSQHCEAVISPRSRTYERETAPLAPRAPPAVPA